MRKLKLKVFKSQGKLLLKAVSSNCRNNCPEVGDNIGLLCIPEFEGNNNGNEIERKPSKRIQDLLDGLALLFFSTCKGVKGCLHSKGGDKLSVVFDLLLALPLSVMNNILINTRDKLNEKSEKTNKKEKKNQISDNRKLDLEINILNNSRKLQDLSDSDQKILSSITEEDAWMTYTLTQVLTTCLIKLFRHLHPSNLAELWLRLLSAAELVVKAGKSVNALEECSSGLSASVECSTVFIVEALLFGLCHTKGRGLSDSDVRQSVENQLINVCLDLCETGLSESRNTDLSSSKAPWRSARLVQRQRLLLCRLWLAFPRNLTLLGRIDQVITAAIPCVWPCPAAPLLASELFPALPVDISRRYLCI